MREPGFYWVKTKSYQEWVICDWFYNHWKFPGDDREWLDEYFAEIDERRIVREENEEEIIVIPKRISREENKPPNIFEDYMEYMVKEFARKTMDEFKALNKD